MPADRRQRGQEPGKRRQEQRHLVVDAVHDEHADERHECERANLLRALTDPSHGREHFVDGQLRPERRLVLSRRVEHVVAVEPVGELFGDEVPEEHATSRSSGTSSWMRARPSDSPPRIRAMTALGPAHRSGPRDLRRAPPA